MALASAGPHNFSSNIADMKPRRILTSEIAHAHPLISKAYPTDAYYTKLANRLLDDFYEANVNLKEQTESIIRYASITLACYLEDIVADSGQWRAFSDLCRQMFGWPVPVYHEPEEEYYPDEPSMMAVRFLIWHAATEMDDIWWNPDNPPLNMLADLAYLRLMEEFEEAPINEQLPQDIDRLMDDANEDFYKLRNVMIWLFSKCYLTRSYASELLLDKHKTSNYQVIKDSNKSLYFALNHCIFEYKVGALALYPKDYLAALARTKDKKALSDTIDGMEVFPMNAFQMKVSEDGKTIDLLCTNGKSITIKREEVTLNDKELRKYDGCAASFVSFHGEWFLNGGMTPFEGCVEKWDKLVKSDPEHLPEGGVTANADWFLQRTNGRQMLFFGKREELDGFLASQLQFPKEEVLKFNRRFKFDQPIMVFIDKDEPKNCLQFTFGFCESIKAPDNPFYDMETARNEAVEMLWNEHVGTGAILYMLDRGYLPDILNDNLIMQDNPTEVKDQDARFLLRYMRKERY